MDDRSGLAAQVYQMASEDAGSAGQGRVLPNSAQSGRDLGNGRWARSYTHSYP